MAAGMSGVLAGLLLAAWRWWSPWPGLLLGGLLLAWWLLARRGRTRRGHGNRLLGPAAGLAVGLIWAGWSLARLLAAELPAELIGADLQLEGRVVGLVEERAAPGDRRAQRFEVRVSSCVVSGTASAGCERLRRVQLSDYGDNGVRPGERWRWQVRLRPPRGHANPGGFDRQRHLRVQGIGATGYVRAAIRESGPSGIAAWRGRRASAMAEALADRPGAPLLRALAVGDRTGLTESDWALFRDTGTIHLLVVSGLHIGLVGGLVLGLTRLVQRISAVDALGWRRVEWVGALLAAAAAALYAGLAGFTLPTRRALLMFLVATSLWLAWRPAQPLRGLQLAALAVLVVQPLAIWSAGFWLSFGAVAVILLAVLGQRPPGRWRWWRVQWAACLGLVPALASAGQPVSLLSLPANLLAIPVVSLWVVPLDLLALLVQPRFPALADVLWHGAEVALLSLVAALELLNQVGAPLVWQLAPPRGGALLLATAGVAWLLLPRGWPGRWLGALMLLPLLLARPEPVPPGQWRAAVLDVGQGLAVVVETAGHVLVYDTGPGWGEGSAGRSVVGPYLRWRGLRRIDLMMISHRHLDHSGGAAHLLEDFPVTRTLGGEPVRGVAPASRCRSGQRWRWDSVEFEVLYPARHDRPANSDDHSCVLRVSGGGHSLLLTGDIGRRVEGLLIRRCAQCLRADVLVLPHHGSRTSSSVNFVAAVLPEYGIIASGHHNRFRHPHEEVVIRYRLAGTRLLNTAGEGALLIHGGAPELEVSGWRSR